MGTLDTDLNFWTDHLQANWFTEKHKDFLGGLELYDECLRGTITSLDGDRITLLLIKALNRGGTKAFKDDIEHLCNKFTGWGQRERKYSDPQTYYTKLTAAYRIAMLEFMPNIKEYVNSRRSIRKIVTQ